MGLTEYCVEILPRDADRDVWLRTRRAGLGGSDCSAVLRMNKYASPYTVWEDKTGIAADQPETEVMRWGTLLEPVIREEAARRLGLDFTLPGTLRSLTRPWQQTNLDGLASDGGLFECKNTSAWMSSDWNGQVPDHAELQVQHSMSVTGASHAWVAGLIGGNRLEIARVVRDEDLIGLLIDEEYRFWHDYVLTRTPPPIDGSEATRRALQRRFLTEDRPIELEGADAELAVQLQAAVAAAAAQEKAAAEQKQQAENQFRLLMGGANRATVGGQTIARITGGNWAPKQFEDAHPELAALYRIKVDVIDSAAVRAEHPQLWKQFQGQRFQVSALPTSQESE